VIQFCCQKCLYNPRILIAVCINYSFYQSQSFINLFVSSMKLRCL